MNTPHVNMLTAIQWALARALADDPEVVIFGQDVGQNGGVFRATAGLQERFGKNRVFDTPLDESTIAGMAVGMAVQGIKAVAEIQFCGFSYPILDQIASHAGRMRNRTRGRLSCPLVVRIPYGGGIHAPEHHSESPEAFFAHIPGIRVVSPSTPLHAYGALIAAIRDPDPVIFLEPKRLYHSAKMAVPDDGHAFPLDKAVIRQSGTDLTCVTWGGSVPLCCQAAAEYARLHRGSMEVIDLVTLKPFDIETVLDSVCKTGKLLIVHEAPRTAGLGAEIAAEVAQYAWGKLRAPIVRVTGYDTVPPLSQLERYYLPHPDTILRAAIDLGTSYAA